MRLIKLVHFLSLDVVLGSLAFQALLHQILLGEMPTWAEQISLACSVWGIYLIDRMIDRKKEASSDERHVFQTQHIPMIKIILLFLGLLGVFSLRELPVGLIYFGICLCLAMLIYWLLWYYGVWNRILGSKELATAFLYTLGVGASTFYRIPGTMWALFLGLGLFLLVFQNLAMFTMWELSQNNQALASVFSWKRTLIGVEVLFLVLLLVVLFYGDEKIAFLPFAITFAIQTWIHYFSKDKQGSRMWGELAYCSPILYFAYEFFSK